MPSIIQISDQKNNILSFDLADLLKLLPLNAQQLTWSILDLSQFLLEPDCQYTLGKALVSINEKAHQNPGGYILSWDDLVVYAEAVRQVVDGIFVGCQSIEALSALKSDSSDEELYSVAEVVLEAFDSSCWIVYSRDDQYLNRLRSTFHDTQELESGISN